MENKDTLIKHLGLLPHIEGGFFARTYCSATSASIGPGHSSRHLLTSIYYMLTDDSPTGYLHKNQSDIMHYFHHGSALKYLVLHPDGQLEEQILGNEISKGQQMQLLVKGGCWKATQLTGGEYGLISEAVAPGFEYEDHVIADEKSIKSQFPEKFESLRQYIRPRQSNIS